MHFLLANWYINILGAPGTQENSSLHLPLLKITIQNKYTCTLSYLKENTSHSYCSIPIVAYRIPPQWLLTKEDSSVASYILLQE